MRSSRGPAGQHAPPPRGGGRLPALRKFLFAVLAFGRWRLAAAGALMLGVGMTAGLGLLLLIPVLHWLGVDHGTTGDGVPTALAAAVDRLGLAPSPVLVLGGFVALIALHAGATRARDLLLARLRLEFVDHLRIRAYSAMTHAEWGLLMGTRNADFTHVLTADINRVGQGTQVFLKLAALAAQGAVYLLISFRISPLLTLLTLGVGGAILLLMRRWNGAAVVLGQRLSDSNRGMYGAIGGHLGGMKLAKAFGAENRHLEHFATRVASMRTQQLAFLRNTITLQAAFRIGAAASLATIAYFALEYSLIAPALLVVLVVTYTRLFPLMGAAQQNFHQLLHSLPAFTAVERLHDECRARVEVDDGGDWPRLRESVRLDRVTFAYPGVAAPLFDGVTLEVTAGSTTALTGASGTGKSTLADLLLGLLRPDRGALLVDGVPVPADKLRAWRRQVAYVPQDVYLFHDTLRANLAWSSPAADEAAMWRVLRLAAAEAFVRRLPRGLDTVVGERGIRLSGGERQRIALARALLRNPTLLVLDEATSALDSDHERQIQDAIDALHGQLTILVIAHSVTTLRSADRILLLENGTLREVNVAGSAAR